MLAFTGKYQEAADLLHQYKKTLTHQAPELLLIDVKLSRCYEHLDNEANCSTYWSKAIMQTETPRNADVYRLGKAEFALNQLRALKGNPKTTTLQLGQKIAEVHQLFRDFTNTISYLQLLYIQAKFFMDVEPEHVGSTVTEAMQTLKAVQKEYAPGPDGSAEDKAGYAEIENYLKQYKKSMQGIMLFCGQKAKQALEDEQPEENEEKEEVDEYDVVLPMDEKQ